MKAYVGLGTNLGNRLENLKTAIKLLSETEGVAVEAVSAVYETAPVGGPDQGPFLNACVSVSTTLPPKSLLDVMLGIEIVMGRVREERWGPRLIDLDLLWCENTTMPGPDLELPHPRLTERDFVLIPLAELAPDLVPVRPGKSVAEILAGRQPAADVKLFLPPGWVKPDR